VATKALAFAVVSGLAEAEFVDVRIIDKANPPMIRVRFNINEPPFVE